MKTHNILQNPIARKMYDYKFNHFANVLWGNPRKAKEAYRNYAQIAVDNFETAVKVPSPIKGCISLFSRAGFNCIKYLIYNLFAKDSPEEKRLKTMLKNYESHKENFK